MNSILLLVIVIVILIFFILKTNTKQHFASSPEAEPFFPTSFDLILERNCESSNNDLKQIDYYDCMDSDNCEANPTLKRTISICNRDDIKIYIDMIYGNQYIFINNPVHINSSDDTQSDVGLILTKLQRKKFITRIKDDQTDINVPANEIILSSGLGSKIYFGDFNDGHLIIKEPTTTYRVDISSNPVKNPDGSYNMEKIEELYSTNKDANTSIAQSTFTIKRIEDTQNIDKFKKTDGSNAEWLKVGEINNGEIKLKKLYSGYDLQDNTVLTQINWNYNDPIVFLHQNNKKLINIKHIENSSPITYYNIDNSKPQKSAIIIISSIRDGKPINIDNMYIFRSNEIITETSFLDNIDALKSNDYKVDDTSNYKLMPNKINETEPSLLLEFTETDSRKIKLDSKTLYYFKDTFNTNAWGQTSNPSEKYVNKSLSLLSKIKKNEEEIDLMQSITQKLIEKINL